MLFIFHGNAGKCLRRHLVRTAILTCLVFMVFRGSLAQNINASELGGSIALQDVQWRFAQGDKAEWKDAGFDDSGWKLSVPSQGPPKGSRCKDFCWYRVQVSVPPQSRDLSLGLNNVDTSYEVFVNGHKLGGHGKLPPHASNYPSNLTLFPLPQTEVSTGVLHIAIRLWVSGISASGAVPTGMGPSSTVLLGKTSELEIARERDVATTIYTIIPGMLNGLLGLLVGFCTLLLYRSQRDHREYLWLFGMGAFLAMAVALDPANDFDLVPAPLYIVVSFLLGGAVLICNIEFILAFIQKPASRLFRILEWSFLPSAIIVVLGVYGLIPLPLLQAAAALSPTLVNIGIPILLILAYKRGNREAGLLLIPVFFLEMASYGLMIVNLLAQLLVRGNAPSIPQIHLGPVAFQVGDLLTYMCWLTVGLIVLLRNSVIVRERERVAGELQAAKAVQEVLMPKLHMATPGFILQSAYRPAQEVGGDFFHVTPAEDGSLRVVIGDVSGKGLKAAMTVALIVGALDRETSLHPGEVLSGLNRMLTQHSTGGFATCLCLSITSQGVLTAANAGHFTPYQNGLETNMEGSLPLGLYGGAEYDEAQWSVHPGDHLVLFTDGVPEARDAGGALFGFERTNNLIANSKSPEEIATAAQAFGQDDDITVVQIAIQSSL